MNIKLSIRVLISLLITTLSQGVVVTNALDNGAGSLRDALASNDSNVTFDATFFATPRTITLASGLVINRAKNITGPGAAKLTISGVDLYRILDLSRPGINTNQFNVNISGITFTRGRTTAGGGAAIREGQGVILTLTDCTFRDNENIGTNGDSGGAIAFLNSESSIAERIIERCSFTDNTTASNGGAILIDTGSNQARNNIVFVACSFTGNSATPAALGSGGAIYQFRGISKITRSTFESNSAYRGGATFLNSGDMSFWSSTLSGNSVSNDGAAIYSSGNLNLNACTITDNTKTVTGAGFGAIYLLSGGNTTIKSSIIAGNMRGSLSNDLDGSGTITSQSGNLFGWGTNITNGTNGTKIINNDLPLLAPLGLFGGLTRTRPPLPGSPAEFLGVALMDGMATWSQDQRGVSYLANANAGLTCGAVQQRPFTLSIVSGGGQSTLINTNFPNPVVVGVTGTSGDPVNGGKIRLRPAPATGASITRTTDFDSPMIALGQTSVSGLTANATPGSYNLQVILPSSLNIPLTNLGIPDINVLGNGVTIPNGDTTPATADHTDFGAIAAAGSATLSRTFTITNTGNGNLLLPANFATVISRGTTPFTISGILNSQGLLPGASTTITVVFDPTTPGVFTSTVQIASNDPDENPYSFSISAQASATAPTDIALSVASIPENSGTTVGSLTRTGGESGTPVYTLVAGSGASDNALCTISGTGLRINVAADFETKSSYAFRIRVTEPSGANFEKALTFAITNVNEAPSWTAGSPPQVPALISTPQTIASWATNINDGDTTVTQGLTFTSTVLTGANLFHTAPSLDTAGNLNYRPNTTGLSGTATVRFTLTDDTSIGGGAALTHSQVITFSIGLASPTSSPFMITSISFTRLVSPLVGANVVINASGPSTLGSRLWILKASDDLQTWSAGIAQQTASASGTATFNITDVGATGPMRFYRIEVP